MKQQEWGDSDGSDSGNALVSYVCAVSNNFVGFVGFKQSCVGKVDSDVKEELEGFRDFLRNSHTLHQPGNNNINNSGDDSDDNSKENSTQQHNDDNKDRNNNVSLQPFQQQTTRSLF